MSYFLYSSNDTHFQIFQFFFMPNWLYQSGLESGQSHPRHRPVDFPVNKQPNVVGYLAYLFYLTRIIWNFIPNYLYIYLPSRQNLYSLGSHQFWFTVEVFNSLYLSFWIIAYNKYRVQKIMVLVYQIIFCIYGLKPNILIDLQGCLKVWKHFNFRPC